MSGYLWAAVYLFDITKLEERLFAQAMNIPAHPKVSSGKYKCLRTFWTISRVPYRRAQGSAPTSIIPTSESQFRLIENNLFSIIFNLPFVYPHIFRVFSSPSHLRAAFKNIKTRDPIQTMQILRHRHFDSTIFSAPQPFVTMNQPTGKSNHEETSCLLPLWNNCPFFYSSTTWHARDIWISLAWPRKREQNIRISG